MSGVVSGIAKVFTPLVSVATKIIKPVAAVGATLFTGGAAIRAVYQANPDYFAMENVIPGGQNGSAFGAHYKDEMYLWVQNKAHPIHFGKTQLTPDAESCWILGK